MKRALVGLGLAVALALGATGIALASIPDAEGVIHGCIKNSTGELKVIDDAIRSCPGGHTPLNWNQTGPAGPPGSGTGYEAVTVVISNSVETLSSCPEGKFLVERYMTTEGNPPMPQGGQYVVDVDGRITGARWQPTGFDSTGTIICVNG
jgi:hypothetical protein